MSEPADARLIERLKGGDEDALATIYDRFCTRLYRTAVGLCASHDDAEDVVHDTFLGLWNARTTISHIDDLTAYLFASLRYAAARQRKRLKRRRMILDNIEQRAKQDGLASNQDSTCDDIRELLQSLPEEQREIVVMKIYGGLTFGEAANALGISANTAASRYRYALEKLRDRLSAEKAQYE
jgi:RNA polymerase sigma-70 factor, ECF subfamily